MARQPTASAPDISVVVPVFDEEGAAPALAREIAQAFKGRNYEMVFVDDASRDGTKAALKALAKEIPQLRVLGHARNAGQSRAIRSGIRAGPPDLALVGGERVKRQDSYAKKAASRIGNGVRKRLLNDTANDTGCGLKAFRREAFLRLPYFDHIHRYLPALMLREGYLTAFRPVNHRHRESGVSKYTNLGRLWASLSDLFGVVWLQARARNPGGVDEV